MIDEYKGLMKKEADDNPLPFEQIFA